MYMIVNLAMGSKNFGGVGFVDAESAVRVAFEIDRIPAWQIDPRVTTRLGRKPDAHERETS